MRYLIAYLAVAVPFLGIDMIWLTIMASRLYRPALDPILRPEPALWAAGLFYLVYPVGLVGFAVLPAYQEGSAARALTSGLMFGFFTYATYDLTNLATLRNWSATITAADICWGSVLGATSALIGYLAVGRLFAAS